MEGLEEVRDNNEWHCYPVCWCVPVVRSCVVVSCAAVDCYVQIPLLKKLNNPNQKL